MIFRFFHWIEHIFGWNGGIVECWHARNGRLMVGFRCVGCGKLTGIHPSVTENQSPEHKYDR